MNDHTEFWFTAFSRLLTARSNPPLKELVLHTRSLMQHDVCCNVFWYALRSRAWTKCKLVSNCIRLLRPVKHIMQRSLFAMFSVDSELTDEVRWLFRYKGEYLPADWNSAQYLFDPFESAFSTSHLLLLSWMMSYRNFLQSVHLLLDQWARCGWKLEKFFAFLRKDKFDILMLTNLLFFCRFNLNRPEKGPGRV